MSEQRVMLEIEEGEAEREDPIAREIAWRGLEVQPAENQGERDGGGGEASPHDEHVRQAARPAALPDEAIEEKDAGEPLQKMGERRRQPIRPQKGFPAASPIHARGRALKPHRVTIGDPERREERGEGVAHQGRVDVA